jgi:lipopolysaccharide/colanic/teichoic acid biosynthesis glycosyltransferase
MLQLQSYSQAATVLQRRRRKERAETARQAESTHSTAQAAVADRVEPRDGHGVAATPSKQDDTIRVELIDAVPSLGTGPDRAIRAANVTIAALLLIVLSPIMLLVALAVRLTSKGPVIYRQVRVGVDRRRYRGLSPLDRRAERERRDDSRKAPGRRRVESAAPPVASERRAQSDRRDREFDRRVVQVAVSEDRRRHERRDSVKANTDRRSRIATALSDRRSWNVYGKSFVMYKFRTMRVDAETGTGAVWAQKNDPRVTPIGGFLRKTRLDELPQLINVLKGDMNIVGPRPERPPIVVNLVSSIPQYPIRQRTRPGITGLAQISHSYDQSLDDVRAKVRYDLEYLRRRSVVEDLRIMCMTPMVMFFKRTGQ